MSGLEIKQISKRFGNTEVLKNVSVNISEGELLVLLGASGCGKSTLLRIIAGLEEADQGEIHISGKRVDQLPPKDRNVALVFQNYSLYPHMSVAENLEFPLKVKKVPKTERTERVQQIAQLLGLGDRLNDRPAQLSGGQRQRVALGRAIIREPALFLLDEPLSNLDAELRLRMRQEIVALQRRTGKSMVHVTHDQVEALTMADRIALLKNGQLEQLGSPEELYQRPASVYVASFLGQPAINIVPGEVVNNELQPFGLSVPEQATVPRNRPLLIGIRPESVHVVPLGESRATVTAYEYLGDRYMMTVQFKQHALRVSTVAADPPPIGEPVHISLRLNDLLFFDPATEQRIVASGLSGDTTIRSRS